jgi:hypothetical protein
MAPMGGARITDKAIHTFYFVKNGIRLYRRHSTSFGLPAFCLKMTAYAAAKSVKNQDPRILSQGIRAVSVGISQALKLTGNGDLPA